MALELRRHEHGGYPEKLEALVPEYLHSVPIDPWDAEPVRYSRDARLLWSVHSEGGWHDGVVPEAEEVDGSAIRRGGWAVSF